MKTRETERRTLLAGIAATLLAGAACTRGPVNTAPRFRGKTLTGERFDSDSLKGKVVLIQFWATWCRYCRADQEAVDAIATRFAAQNVVVLAANVGEDRSKVMAYLERSPRACKIVLAEDSDLASAFGAESFPLYILIGRDGSVAGDQRGAGGAPALLRLLAKAGVAAG
jgi:cytochrome c biogenesis protein CcmG, thiol:disulfide interchange protein DsbE